MSGKMIMLFVICALPLACGAQGNENGTDFDGLQLRDACHAVEIEESHLSYQDGERRIECEYYVFGVYDGFRSGDSEYKICTPKDITVREMALVVSKYLYQHPEKLHNPVPHLVIDALLQTFSCAQSETQ
jgi:Ssp1 endopeptidase immunity protein Rap1a